MKRRRDSEEKDENPPKRNKIDKKFREIQKFRKNLPIFSCRSSILDYFRKNQVLMVVGETGCGKTTQIPQYLYNSSTHEVDGKSTPPNIVITQPRRLAATEIAKRVNYELLGNNSKNQLGDVVGYKVRFKSCVKSTTRLSFLTDGMLIRESQEDPLLLKYDVIIIDEAHERTLHTEILLGIVKKLLGIRTSNHEKPLKLIVMSATLEVEKFKRFFSAPVLMVDGRMHPISIFYSPKPIKKMHDGIVHAVLQVHLDGVKDYIKGADILVFSTGSQEIEELAVSLERRARDLPRSSDKLIVCKLYAALPERIKSESFKKVDRGCRKVILATNIAETSLTIPGVKYVIDSGEVKMNHYDSQLRQDVLSVQPISKSQATQRSGRAGREQPGICYRLYEEDRYRTFRPYPVPEIQRSNLSSVILQMISMGIRDLHNFSFLDPPNNLGSSLENLELIGAIQVRDVGENGTNYELTPLGRNMAILPLDPLYSITLLKSVLHNSTIEVLAIISIVLIDSDEGGVFYYPMREQEKAGRRKMSFASPYGDHFTLLNVFGKYLEKKAGPYTRPQTAKHITMRKRKEQELQDFCTSNYLSHKKMKKACSVLRQLTDYCRQIDAFKSIDFFKDENRESNIKRSEEMTLIESAVLERYQKKAYSVETIQKCFLEGFWMNTATQTEKLGRYRTWATHQFVYLHPTSSLKRDWDNIECIVFCSIVKTTKEYVRNVMKVDKKSMDTVIKSKNMEERRNFIARRTKSLLRKNLIASGKIKEEEDSEEGEEEVEGEDFTTTEEEKEVGDVDKNKKPVFYGPPRPPHLQRKIPTEEEKEKVVKKEEKEEVDVSADPIVPPPPPPPTSTLSMSQGSSMEAEVKKEEEVKNIEEEEEAKKEEKEKEGEDEESAKGEKKIEKKEEVEEKIVPPPPPQEAEEPENKVVSQTKEERGEEEIEKKLPPQPQEPKKEEPKRQQKQKQKQPKKKKRKRKRRKGKKGKKTEATVQSKLTNSKPTGRKSLNRNKNPGRKKKPGSEIIPPPPVKEKMKNTRSTTTPPFMKSKPIRKYGKKKIIQKKKKKELPKNFFELSAKTTSKKKSSQTTDNSTVPPPPSTSQKKRIRKRGRKKKKKKKKKKKNITRSSASPKTPVTPGSFVHQVIEGSQGSYFTQQ